MATSLRTRAIDKPTLTYWETSFSVGPWVVTPTSPFSWAMAGWPDVTAKRRENKRNRKWLVQACNYDWKYDCDIIMWLDLCSDKNTCHTRITVPPDSQCLWKPSRTNSCVVTPACPLFCVTADWSVAAWREQIWDCNWWHNYLQYTCGYLSDNVTAKEAVVNLGLCSWISTYRNFLAPLHGLE